MTRSLVRSCSWMTSLLMLTMVLAACGGGGGGGGGSEVAGLLGYQSAEGTKAAPLNIGDLATSGVVSHEGSVAGAGLAGVGDTADSYYLVTGVQPGVVYTITMSNLTDNADVYVYQQDPTYKATASSNVQVAQGTETFTVIANPNVSSFFIGVDSSSTQKGATFTLSTLVQPISEGSASSPLDLYSLPVQRKGSTVAFDNACTDDTPDACGPSTKDSFYMVKNVSVGPKLITLSDLTDDVDLYVYKFAGAPALVTNGDGGITNTPVCSSTQEDLAIETCQVTAAGGDTLVIVVDGNYSAAGAAYTLNIIDAPSGPDYASHSGGDDCNGFPCLMNSLPAANDPIAELFIRNFNNSNGTTTVKKEADPAEPVAGISGCLTSALPFGDGGIGVRKACPDSYYVANTSPGRTYRLYMEKMTDKANLWVFGKDGSYNTPICQPPYPREDVQACTFTAKGTKVYFAVDGSSTAAGAAYTLGMLPAFTGDGTLASPKELCTVDVDGTCIAFDNTSINAIGTVLKDGVLGIATSSDSYYKVTGLTAGDYIVSLPALSDDVNLYVYGDDSTFTTPTCVPFQGGGAPENCVVTISGGTIYFAVDGYFTSDGGAYLISVSALTAEGTKASPVDLGGAPAGYYGHVITQGGGTDGVTDDGIDSFYKVTVTPNKTYRVDTRISRDVNGDPVNQVHLRVYTDSAFTALACEATEDEFKETRCNAAAGSSSTLYFYVDGENGTAPFANYQIEVREDGGAATTPIALTGAVTTVTAQTVNSGGYPGAFGDSNDRYYSFDPNPNKHYTVKLKNMSSNVNLVVFRGTTANPFSNFLCMSTNTGNTDEVCDHQTGYPVIGSGQIDDSGSSTTRITIGVDGFSVTGASATFDIEIDEIDDVVP